MGTGQATPHRKILQAIRTQYNFTEFRQQFKNLPVHISLFLSMVFSPNWTLTFYFFAESLYEHSLWSSTCDSFSSQTLACNTIHYTSCILREAPQYRHFTFLNCIKWVNYNLLSLFKNKLLFFSGEIVSHLEDRNNYSGVCDFWAMLYKQFMPKWGSKETQPKNKSIWCLSDIIYDIKTSGCPGKPGRKLDSKAN